MNGDDLSEQDKQELKVSLRHYFERLLLEHEKSHVQLARQVEVALVAMDKRLDGMNEFRGSLADVTARSVSRETFEAKIEQSQTRLNALEAFRGRASLIATGVALTAGTLGAIVGAVIISIIHR